MSELARDAKLLLELANDLDVDVTEDLWSGLDQGLTCFLALEEANRQLATVRAELAKKLADAFPTDEKGCAEKRVVVEGVGVFERHRKADRKAWDKEELLRVVLDTQLVNPNTGEITDPNQLDKVLHVWNLGAPRVTALRERGIDPDEFCQTEYGSLTLQIVADNLPKESAA